MLWILIILPLIIGLGLLYWGSQLSEDNILRLAFQLFYIPSAWLSIHFATLVVASEYPALTEVITLLGEVTYYLGWILFIVGAYLLYKLLMGIVDIIQQKKADKESEKYD